MAMEKSGILAGVIKVSKEVSKGKLGEKRVCGSCGAKFYDLGKTPIICPKCGTPYEEASTPAKASAPVAPVKEKPVVKEVGLETDDAADSDDVEVVEDDDTTVSLEDAIEDDLSEDEEDELDELKEFDEFEEDFEEDDIDEDDSDVALIDDNEE